MIRPFPLRRLLPLALLALAACNTIEGAGEDLSGAGEAISDAARGVERTLD